MSLEGRKIALLGAAGAIGQSIAGCLAPGRPPVSRGGPFVRATGPNCSATIRWPRSYTWNPDDPDRCVLLRMDIDSIVYLVGVNYWQLASSHASDGKDAGRSRGRRRQALVLIGTVYPYGRARTEGYEEPAGTPYLQGQDAKGKEDLLLEATRPAASRPPYSGYPTSTPASTRASSTPPSWRTTGGAANLADLGTPHEFVFVPDVGSGGRASARHPGGLADRPARHLAGAGVTSQQAMVDEIARQAGRPVKVRAAGKWLLRVFGLFNPFMREMVEMHYLLTEPSDQDDARRRGSSVRSPRRRMRKVSVKRWQPRGRPAARPRTSNRGS